MNAPMKHHALEEDTLRREIDAFHAAYCDVLDCGRLAEWPEFFTEDGFYRVIARENRDLGLPVGLVYCEGRKMMHDRAFAIRNTAMYAPRYVRHFVSNVRIDAVEGGGATIRARGMTLQSQWRKARLGAHLSEIPLWRLKLAVSAGREIRQKGKGNAYATIASYIRY